MGSEKRNIDRDRLVATLTIGELIDIIRQESRIPGGSSGLLSPKELAERLGVPTSWVYEKSRLGEIPSHRVGKYPRFDLVEVLESEARSKNNGDSS